MIYVFVQLELIVQYVRENHPHAHVNICFPSHGDPEYIQITKVWKADQIVINWVKSNFPGLDLWTEDGTITVARKRR
jgi:hypothetical protein